LKPKFSIILPVYNNANIIGTVLTSIINQTYPIERIEIIAVDDASTDESLQNLKRFQTKHEELLKIIEHKENQGRACTRNDGINLAQGDLLLFLDSDISIHEKFIERTVNFINQKDVIGVMGKILPGKDIKQNNYNKYQKYLYQAPRGAMQLEKPSPVSYSHFLFSITTIKSKAIDKIGLMDENLTHHGGEDTEYAFRLEQKYSNQLYFNPNLKGYHHDFVNFKTALNRMRKYGKFNVPYIIKKHPQMKEIYFYDFLEGNLIQRFLGIIATSKSFITMMHFLYKYLPVPLVFGVIKILFGSMLLQGIEAGRKS